MFPAMAWQTLLYPLSEVSAAGEVLIEKHPSRDNFAHAQLVIDNWRAAHAFPLNTFQMGLREKARRVDDQALVAQRIKRLASIEHKLRLMRRLKLSEMQDVGGCRAILIFHTECK